MDESPESREEGLLQGSHHQDDQQQHMQYRDDDYPRKFSSSENCSELGSSFASDSFVKRSQKGWKDELKNGILKDESTANFFAQSAKLGCIDRIGKLAAVFQMGSQLVALMGFIIGVAVIAPQDRMNKFDAIFKSDIAFIAAIALPTLAAVSLFGIGVANQIFFLVSFRTGVSLFERGYLVQYSQRKSRVPKVCAIVIGMVALWMGFVTYYVFESFGHLLVLASLAWSCASNFLSLSPDSLYESLMSVKRFVELCNPEKAEDNLSDGIEQVSTTATELQEAGRRMTTLVPYAIDEAVCSPKLSRALIGKRIRVIQIVVSILAFVGVGYATYEALQANDAIWNTQIIPCTEVCLQYAQRHLPAGDFPTNPPVCTDCIASCMQAMNYHNELKYCKQFFNLVYGNTGITACSKDMCPTSFNSTTAP